MTERDFIAPHVKTLGSSGIRRAFDLAASLVDPVNFSIGQPDFPVPDSVKDAIARAVRDNRNGYTVTRGLPELRERLAHNLRTELGYSPDVFVTSGLSGGLHLSLMTAISPGDEVVMADPYFVSYPQLVRMVHGVAVPVPSYDSFGLDVDRWERAITSKTKVLIVCSPSNPTGVVYRESDIRALAELARRRELLIVSDEIYEPLSYDGPSVTPARFAPERTIVLRGFGKSHAMTGLRIGYAAGPEKFITEMAKLQQYTFVCAPHPVQVGALAALDTDVAPQRDAYRHKRDLVCRELTGVVDFVRPGGGFYVFPKVPARFANAAEFFEAALQRNLIIIPGDVFSERNTHFRISYAVPSEKIQAGCAIVRDLAK